MAARAKLGPMSGPGDSRRAWASLFLLFLTLAILASLQTKWLGEASRAQRDRAMDSMRGAAERFAQDFDREISRLYVALQSDARQSGSRAASLAAQVDRWETGTTTPSLLRDLLLVRREGDGFTSSRLDRETSRFLPLENDADLDAILALAQEWTEGRAKGNSETRPMASSFPILAQLPGLLIPRVDMPGFRAMRSGEERPSIEFIVARLSRDAIASDLLPSLKARHFPLPLWQGYEITLVDAAGDVVGPAPSPTRGSLSSDVEESVFALLPRDQLFRLASDLHPDPTAFGHLGDRRPGEDFFRGSRRLFPPFSGGSHAHGPGLGWRLLVRHPGGSLDAAVKQAHLRNLSVSFAVLALLAATAIALLVFVRRSQRLADRQMKFVAGVSHELRTPVAGIRSLAQNLADGVVDEPERVREYGRNIEIEGARLAEMVEQVLARAGILSGQTESNREEIDLREVLELAISDSQERLLANSAQVRPCVPESLPSLVGDPATLRRGLRNLIENAATHGGPGDISVRIEKEENRGHPEIALAVEDGGPGVPENELDSIFEPFFRGQRAREHQLVGSGLGLSLVAEIATLFGGRVTVANRSTGGATFTLHLPMAQEPS